jgi:hypothetical protein
MAVARLYTRFVCKRSKDKQLVLTERADIVDWRSKTLIKLQQLEGVCGKLHVSCPIGSVAMCIPEQHSKLFVRRPSHQHQLQLQSCCRRSEAINHRPYRNIIRFTLTQQDAAVTASPDPLIHLEYYSSYQPPPLS